MKLVNYDQKTNRLYVGKPLVIALILSGLTLLGLIIFWVIFLYAFSTTQYSFDQRQLGEVPQEVQEGANPNQAAQELIKGNETKYANTLNILFFLDGFKKSEEGLVYVNNLKASLSSDPYFKKVLPQISTTIFTSEGNKCGVEDNFLTCDTRTKLAFTGLGIPHMKIVILSQLDFQSQAEQAYGGASFISLSTVRKDIGRDFIQGLKKSISMDAQPANYQEQYLRGVAYCFYGKKESYLWGGKFKSCMEFMKKYPNFWKE